LTPGAVGWNIAPDRRAVVRHRRSAPRRAGTASNLLEEIGMQDEPNSGTEAPQPEPTMAGALQEVKEAVVATGNVLGATVKKAVKKARSAVKKAAKKAAGRKTARKKAAKARRGARKAARTTRRKARKVARKVRRAGRKVARARRKAGRAKK
jgi:hypothetical protein